MLYRGSVAEAGDVEKVVGDPKHPYTQLLVGSVPLPDPDTAWHGEPPPSEEARKAAAVPHDGCAFAARCPNAMQICREERPPLYQIDEHRAAACYLYLGQPEVADRRDRQGDGPAGGAGRLARLAPIPISDCRSRLPAPATFGNRTDNAVVGYNRRVLRRTDARCAPVGLQTPIALDG